MILTCGYPKQLVEREIEIMKALHYSRIVKYFHHCIEGHSLFFVMEFLEGGTLADFIQNQTLPPEGEVVISFCKAADLSNSVLPSVQHNPPGSETK